MELNNLTSPCLRCSPFTRRWVTYAKRTLKKMPYLFTATGIKLVLKTVSWTWLYVASGNNTMEIMAICFSVESSWRPPWWQYYRNTEERLDIHSASLLSFFGLSWPEPVICCDFVTGHHTRLRLTNRYFSVIGCIVFRVGILCSI